MTQKMKAQKGIITKEMKVVAREEGVSAEWLREKIASGRIVIPVNRNHRGVKPVGIGEGLRIKVNTNLGTSSDHVDLEEELKKLEVSIQAGTDTVMDLSTGGDIDAIRKEIIRHSPIPVGTVPIYEAAIKAAKKRKALAKTRGTWDPDPEKKKKYQEEWMKSNREYYNSTKREWYARNKVKELTKHQKRRFMDRHSVIMSYGGYKCACPGGCSVTEDHFLTLDHIGGGGNKHRKEIGSHIYSWLRRHNYPSGFRILCMNCNFSFGHWGFCPHQESSPTATVL